MTKEERKVIRLYTLSKLSEQQIAEGLSLPPARVRWIIRKNKIPKRSISEAIRYLHITKYKRKTYKLKDSLTAAEESLKLAGVMLYWGEGTKRGGTVALHNSHPDLIAVFIRFLREICGVHPSRLHATLHVYPDHNISSLKKYWSDITKIPLTHFYKPYVHQNTKGSYKKKSQYGTLAIVYSDSKLLEVINAWIAEYSTMLTKRRPSSDGRATHL